MKILIISSSASDSRDTTHHHHIKCALNCPTSFYTHIRTHAHRHTHLPDTPCMSSKHLCSVARVLSRQSQAGGGRAHTHTRTPHSFSLFSLPSRVVRVPRHCQVEQQKIFSNPRHHHKTLTSDCGIFIIISKAAFSEFIRPFSRSGVFRQHGLSPTHLFLASFFS